MRAIDADALENDIREWIKAKDLNYEYGKAVGLEIALKCVAEALTITPERKRGRWTKEDACEFCGFKPWYEMDIHTLSFCPNCGAYMREGDTDD